MATSASALAHVHVAKRAEGGRCGVVQMTGRNLCFGAYPVRMNKTASDELQLLKSDNKKRAISVKYVARAEREGHFYYVTIELSHQRRNKA